jgi:hypothetical protein
LARVCNHQKAWDWLKKNGPANTRGIQAQFGWKMHSTYLVLQILRKKGSVRYIGNHKQGAYIAVGKRPDDLRGATYASQRALSRKWDNYKRPIVTPKAQVASSPLAQALAWPGN